MNDTPTPERILTLDEVIAKTSAEIAEIWAQDRGPDTPERCAECDCENGGADCTWLKTPPTPERIWAGVNKSQGFRACTHEPPEGVAEVANLHEYVRADLYTDQRAAWERCRRFFEEKCKQANKAMAERDTLKAENARLREALEPFAECCKYIKPDESDEEWAKFRLLIKNYRAAHAALKQEGEG